MRSTTKKKIVATAIAACFTQAGAFGEEREPDNDKHLANVVVSAARIEQTTLEAPAAVTVIDADKLDASGAVRIGDALTAKVPSFYMRFGLGTSSRINTAPIVTFRGLSDGRVKMMVDGMSLSDGNAAGLTSLMSIPMGEVEQIEVVPGSASALYGSDAMGGVVNVITKIPTKRETNVKISHGFGDGERNALEASYRNKWDNGIAATLGLGYEDMAGFAGSDLVVLPVSTTGTGANAVQGGRPTTTVDGTKAYVVGDQGAIPSHANSLHAKVFYSLDAQSRFFAGFNRSESNIGYQRFNNYLTKNGAPLSLPASNVSINGDKLGDKLGNITASSFWNSSNPNYRQETRYFAGFDGKLGGGYDLKVNVGYFDRDSYYVGSGSGATFAGGPGTRTSTPNTTLDASAQLGFAVGSSQYLIVGLSTNRANLHRKVYQLSSWRDPGSTTGALNEKSDGESTTNSIFLQDQIFLGSALTLYVGGRYDRWSTSGKMQRYVGTPVGTLDAPERSDSAFSPKVAAVYRLTPNTSLRSSLGRAFRAPSNYEMYATPSVSTSNGVSRLLVADPNLKPETATSWDLGIETALADQGSVKATYYRTRLQDMIYRKLSPYTGPLPNVSVFATATNAGEAKVEGVELAAEIPLTSWLRASASYTWTDSRITRDDSSTGLQDKRLRYVPKNTAFFALDAQWQKWRAYLSTAYTGEQFSKEDNSDTVKNVYSGVSRYWLSNLKVSYQLDRNFKASVGINNLFDRTYYEYYQMPGRNAYVELSASF
ncbi:TonB-dependent receptor [Oryzomicrobium sp.]|uniref:TonB-dependent receptor n=1 Tax=Oryzomicrobium sp. TaxID=1911578 RepID=UPI0025E3BB7B|nr:TonB-dependent receptor [Oryzomicrobium sp.]MCE1242090.1 TonB-dependent receptor [Oryzomicrobium sp.]